MWPSACSCFWLCPLQTNDHSLCPNAPPPTAPNSGVWNIAWSSLCASFTASFHHAVANKKKDGPKGKHGDTEPVPAVECTVFRADVCVGGNILKDGEDPRMKVLWLFLHAFEHKSCQVLPVLFWTASNFASTFLRTDLLDAWLLEHSKSVFFNYQIKTSSCDKTPQQ